MDIVKYIIEACRADIEAKTKGGNTALLVACQYGRLEIVQYLIKTCNANAKVQNNKGQTFHDMALKNKWSSVIECLTEATTMTTVLSEIENELHPKNEVEVRHQVCYFMINCPLDAEKSCHVNLTFLSSFFLMNMTLRPWNTMPPLQARR